MTSWPKRPILYEINTRLWLAGLSRQYGREILLGNAPERDWDDLARLGVDAVWLMGVWERSPAGKAIALADAGVRADLRNALPDYSPDDLVGSPYCIHRYIVDATLGGQAGLAIARASLASRGIRLLLDFVPNHVAPDHPWVKDHPEYFIAGDAADIREAPDAYLEAEGRILARGRDPYFPPWPDVLQLNAFHSRVRRAAAETLLHIASHCDGVRCDMAMLVLNDIFEKTWGKRVGIQPLADYWSEVIPAVREVRPDFLFLAEAYWDREWDLQQQGFNFCYDKRLYDRLGGEDVQAVRRHLEAETTYQERLVRFIENHDEPRAAAVFSPGRARAAAVILATLPGAKLFHEGQFAGRRIRLPVFLIRQPDEETDDALQSFYRELLSLMRRPALREGSWGLCLCSGWSDNRTHEHLLAWYWSVAYDRCLIVVNYAVQPAQGRINIPGWDGDSGWWRLTDVLNGDVYEREAEEIGRSGLYVDLPGWGFHVFHMTPVGT